MFAITSQSFITDYATLLAIGAVMIYLWLQ